MQYRCKTIDEIPEGKYKSAVVRVDFNVPIKDGKVEEGFRIDETWSTIELLLKKNLRVILLAHLGDDGSESLLPVRDYLKKYKEAVLATSIEEAKKNSEAGEKLVLLENIRKFVGEKENSRELAEKLSSLGEIFVNEAFPVSHRSHASVVGISNFLPSFAGLVFKKEVKNLSKVFEAPSPFVLILGGLKADTKTPLVERFLDKADKIIMGGALANDFLKAKGYNMGRSVISKKEIIKKEWLENDKFILPESVIVKNSDGSKEIQSDSLSSDDMIVDVGNEFLKKIEEVLATAKFIVWNGSFGICEEGFENGTRGVAESVIKSGAFSLIGGGDTTAAVSNFKLIEKFSFVSTGGGAMLDFLAKGTLPGIEALENSK